MKYVVHYGDIWKMSDLSYLRMLKAIAKYGKSPTWKELRAKKIGHVSLDVTDVDQASAKFALAGLVDDVGTPRKRLFASSDGRIVAEWPGRAKP